MFLRFIPDAAADNTKSALFVSPGAGFFWGRGDEIVYNTPGLPENDSAYTSQLLWDFKPLLYLGLDLDYGPRFLWASSGFNAGLALKYGLPLDTGIMEDFDWLATGASYLTNYSRHTASSRGSPLDIFSGLGTFTADLSLGYSWAFDSVFWIKLFGELSYQRYSWMSRDGYTQYGEEDPKTYLKPWSPDLPKNPWTGGRAVAYTQNWFVFTIGFDTGFRITDYFGVSFLSSLWSPFIYGYCHDEHYSGDRVYLDYLYGGFAFETKLTFKFFLSEKLEFYLSGGMRNLSGAKGDTFSSEKGGPYSRSKDSGGGGFDFYEIAAGLKFIL